MNHKCNLRRCKKTAYHPLCSSRLPQMPIPDTCDIQNEFLPPRNQGSFGSCFAFAGSGAFESQVFSEGGAKQYFSPLFLATVTRHIAGTLNVDEGATLDDMIKAAKEFGMVPETDYPYGLASDSYYKLPPSNIIERATKWQVLQATTIAAGKDTPELMRHAIAAGYPVVFGVSLYSSFESAKVAKTGIVPMPRFYERQIGGHAMLTNAYKPGYFRVRNSWDITWGEKGYCWMPDAYFANDRLFWDGRVISQTELGQ